MFAELVCGPPGSGKTTYCEGKRQFLEAYDPSRPVVLVNMDPANDGVFPYPCDVNVRELVDHAKVMELEQLGPNGSYLFSLDLIGERLDWLREQIVYFAELRLSQRQREHEGRAASGGAAGRASARRAPHLIIDAPGQVEFYLHTGTMHRFVEMLQKKLHCTVCMVHLSDGLVATRDVPTYISTCLLALSAMVDLELPHVNVLTKWDLVMADAALTADGDIDAESFLCTPDFASHHFERLWKRRGGAGLLAGLRDRSADVEGCAESPPKAGANLQQLSRTILDVVEGYGIVGFIPLDVQSQTMMLELVQRVDNAMGNFF